MRFIWQYQPSKKQQHEEQTRFQKRQNFKPLPERKDADPAPGIKALQPYAACSMRLSFKERGVRY